MSERDDAQQALFAATCRLLAQPDTYRDETRAVRMIETHISCVFLTDRLVYKLKKPVHFEFVDFSTLAARHAACQEEVRLNRRLAPHIYLGLLPITREENDALALDGAGAPVDWVVAMRRLPIENTLDARLDNGGPTTSELAGLVRVLGDFYAAAAPIAIDPAVYRREIEQHVRANLRDLSAAAPAALQEDVRHVHAAQLQWLTLRADVFAARVTAGRIIDGHGDLRPEHICLTDPPVVFDCLEFDARLRRLDVADELSFLAMECRRLGAPAVGTEIRAACLERCGDQPGSPLLDFYESYRACVRAKVAALRAAQLADAARAAAWQEGTEYLRLAVASVGGFHRAALLVVGGLMGSGKSTLARALSERMGTAVIQTDAVRRELFPAAGPPADFGAGAYTPENRELVYAEMFARAERQLAAGRTTVLDGTFLGADLLRRVAALARSAAAPLLVVRCHCSDEVARQRIAARHAAGTDLSEARPELYDAQRREVEEIPAEIAHVPVDTMRALEEQLATVIGPLRALVADV